MHFSFLVMLVIGSPSGENYPSCERGNVPICYVIVVYTTVCMSYSPLPRYSSKSRLGVCLHSSLYTSMIPLTIHSTTGLYCHP